MRPQVVDLFGEVPVTHHEISLWLLAVPKMDPDSPRAARYVKDWDVPGKIRAAKLSGRFDEVLRLAELQPSPFWWRHFRWH